MVDLHIVLVSGIQQRVSYTHLFFSFLFLFPYRLLHNIESGYLCYTVGPYWLFILYIIVCIC